MAEGIIDKLRSVRVGRFAVFDFTVAVLGMVLVAPLLKISMLSALLLTVPIGVLVHELLGFRTPLNKLVIESPDCTARVLVAVLTVAGLVSVRIDRSKQ